MVLIIWEGGTFGSDVMLQLIEDLFNTKFNSPLSMMNLFDTPFSNFLHFWLKGGGGNFMTGAPFSVQQYILRWDDQKIGLLC